MTSIEHQTITLADLVSSLGAKTEDALREEYGARFLLFHEGALDPDRTRRALVTTYIEKGGGSLSAKDILGQARIYPMAKVQGSKTIVTVGRLDSNDICIPDPSVSSMHGLLKVTMQDGLSIMDMGSTNGTTLNGTAVPKEGSGQPMPLGSGDMIRFGSVETTFLDARGLSELIVQAGL
jgi:hypothetical protein